MKVTSPARAYPGTPDTGPHNGDGPLVLLVTAAMGAGHSTTAAELARRLTERGARTATIDLLACSGPAGPRLRDTYRTLLQRAPWLYDAAMRFWLRAPGVMERLTAAGAGPFERALGDEVAALQPDVVVSCYNLASQCLGRLRREERLGTARLVTVVTDPAPHPYWLGPADLVLAYTPDTAASLHALGAPATAWTAPMLRPEFARPPSRSQARRALGIDPARRLAVVSAGSWAAGGLHRALDALSGSAEWDVAALCGRNAEALADAARRPGVRAVGWTDRVADQLAAADVLVDNAGGQTCWEALACGTPVVSYRPLPGHGRLNAATLSALGLVTPARTDGDLLAALVRATGSPHAAVDPFAGPDAADLVLATVLDRVPGTVLDRVPARPDVATPAGLR